MKIYYLLISLVVLAAAIVTLIQLGSRRNSAGSVIHVENGFEFTVRAPYDKVAPLFGAHGERAWGGDDWDPQFLHPQPAHDVEGEVFSVAHGHKNATWVNTAFDLPSGHVQYVYVVPDVQAVLIDIHLQRDDSAKTGVKVLYERTSLQSRFNGHISEMGNKDSGSAAEWRDAIEKYLGVAN
ncbi:MAG TPA: hypothetical protein VLK33_21965 [Terriglobales bacterium]|nr:hypothetical protein [Terriglobales bacterium]